MVTYHQVVARQTTASHTGTSALNSAQRIWSQVTRKPCAFAAKALAGASRAFSKAGNMRVE